MNIKKNNNMMTNATNAKRYFFLLAGFLIFSAAFAQNNFLGFKGSKAIMEHVELSLFKSGQAIGVPDATFDVESYDTYTMKQWGFPQINYYIYENISFEPNKIMGSNACMEYRPIMVNITKKQNGSEAGNAILSFEYERPINVKFRYDNSNKRFFIEYFLTEWDKEKYMIEKAQKINDGLSREVDEYEQTTTPELYMVRAIYFIK